MSEPSNDPVPQYPGPLHLQRFLQTPCPEIEKAMRNAVAHPISSLRGLFCDCRTSAAMRAIPPTEEEASKDPAMADARRRAMEQSKAKINLRHGMEEGEGRSLAPCKFFYIKLNDEAGIYHAICRRCQRVVNVYDRDLYWGTPRKTDAPVTFPYNCGCGGHAFEVAIGFSYPPEALDENDIDTLTVAVRCATCEETAVIFDDEAT